MRHVNPSLCHKNVSIYLVKKQPSLSNPANKNVSKAPVMMLPLNANWIILPTP